MSVPPSLFPQNIQYVYMDNNQCVYMDNNILILTWLRQYSD